jgi:hypothetical protein
MDKGDPAHVFKGAGEVATRNPGSSMFFTLALPIQALLGKEGSATGNLT